jgi:hypothetical protein
VQKLRRKVEKQADTGVDQDQKSEGDADVRGARSCVAHKKASLCLLDLCHHRSGQRFARLVLTFQIWPWPDLPSAVLIVSVIVVLVAIVLFGFALQRIHAGWRERDGLAPAAADICTAAQ